MWHFLPPGFAEGAAAGREAVPWKQHQPHHPHPSSIPERDCGRKIRSVCGREMEMNPIDPKGPHGS